VLDYYQNQGKLVKVDGKKTIKEVSKDIVEMLDTRLGKAK
jgi:adenylate kinase family enzyme